ncbi:MAG TPA: high-potential iron-sulfur protein [Xanthomonadales bacterium]|nr:high-potential iron-sulfur protein [Xanthomonadales bacterium]
MKKTTELNAGRRKLLKSMGGSVALLSVAGLAACSDSGSEPASVTSQPKPQSKPETKPETKPESEPEPQPEPAVETASEPDQTEPAPEQAAEANSQPPAADNGSELPRLSEDQAQAKALGYKTSTGDVDNELYPNHAADQACASCALFTGQPGQEWGPCGIFPGSQVNSGGWCSAYSRKS